MIPYANLEYALFDQTKFCNANLTGVNFLHAEFIDVSFNGAI